MAIKKHKPTTPAAASRPGRDRAELTRSEPEKSLVEGKTKTGGRNAHGRITSRHRGGGAKRRYRTIDFKRRKDGVPAKVAAIEYDPNRTAHIALLHYADGEKRYILAPQRLTVGDEVLSGDERRHPGRQLRCRWRNIPTGTVVHNVELTPGRGGQLGRSAGAAIQLVAKEGEHATLRLPSGEMRMVPRGVPRHDRHDRQRRPPERDDRQGRAASRHKGIRPQTRGTAMNPSTTRTAAARARPRRAATRSRPGACRRSATARARRARRPTATSCAAAPREEAGS